MNFNLSTSHAAPEFQSKTIWMPNSVLFEILKFLDPKTLLKLSEVDKKLKEISAQAWDSPLLDNEINKRFILKPLITRDLREAHYNINLAINGTLNYYYPGRRFNGLEEVTKNILNEIDTQTTLENSYLKDFNLKELYFINKLLLNPQYKEILTKLSDLKQKLQPQLESSNIQHITARHLRSYLETQNLT